MSDWGLGELLACVLARSLRDGELGILGTSSPIAVAACNLAQRRGRWVSWMSRPLGVLDPRTDRLLGTADERLIPTSSAALDLPYTVDFVAWRPHFFDFAVMEGLQVDRYGNLNTVCLGPHDKPRLRGPGTLGASALAGLSRRFMVLSTRHEPSVLVETVDFRSAVGHHRGGRTRETELGLPPGGPDLVVTPLGCFDFHPESKAMRVPLEVVLVQEVERLGEEPDGVTVGAAQPRVVRPPEHPPRPEGIVLPGPAPAHPAGLG